MDLLIEDMSKKIIVIKLTKDIGYTVVLKELDILFCSITPTNLGQILKPGTDLESAGPDVFKTPPTCPI